MTNWQRRAEAYYLIGTRRKTQPGGGTDGNKREKPDPSPAAAAATETRQILARSILYCDTSPQAKHSVEVVISRGLSAYDGPLAGLAKWPTAQHVTCPAHAPFGSRAVHPSCVNPSCVTDYKYARRLKSISCFFPGPQKTGRDGFIDHGSLHKPYAPPAKTFRDILSGPRRTARGAAVVQPPRRLGSSSSFMNYHGCTHKERNKCP